MGDDIDQGESLLCALRRVPDHRRGQGRRYPLAEMLCMSVAAMLCGCRSIYAIAQWARDNRRMLQTELGLRSERTPCQTTFHRVFVGLDVEAFESVLSEWLSRHFVPKNDPLAVDGKALRGLHGDEVAGVHLVAAYAHKSGVVVSQAQCPGKGQELRAGRELVAREVVAGRVLTLDALYAARSFCDEVVARGGTT
jgi:hypothetical protein